MISIHVDAAQVEEALRTLIERERDFREPLTEILTMSLGDAAEEVSSGKGSGFGGWAPMHPLTPVVARVLYGRDRDPGSLLRATGGLLASLGPGGAGNVLDVGQKEGLAGTGLSGPRSDYPIGRFQQDGTRRTFHVLQGEGFSETGIPARPFLAWHEERFDEYDEILASHLFPGIEI